MNYIIFNRRWLRYSHPPWEHIYTLDVLIGKLHNFNAQLDPFIQLRRAQWHSESSVINVSDAFLSCAFAALNLPAANSKVDLCVPLRKNKKINNESAQQTQAKRNKSKSHRHVVKDVLAFHWELSRMALRNWFQRKAKVRLLMHSHPMSFFARCCLWKHTRPAMKWFSGRILFAADSYARFSHALSLHEKFSSMKQLDN